ncbi:MAG TPA: hypothetical protein VNC79_12775 [Mycobacteriales bacterium]|nr:hypothetical protein [Mycobacteriales bacterium]
MGIRPPEKRPSLAHRLLDQKTVWQKVLIAVGTVATAITAVAGVVALILPLFRAAPEAGAFATPAPVPAATRLDSAVPAGSAVTNGGVTVIQTQSAEADALVRSLIATAGRAPILLDHQIMGKPGPANVTLYYGCGQKGACSMTRIEVAALEGMAVLTGDPGVWLRGCFSVTLDGLGYAADHLDIELRKVGEGCPT